MPSPLFASLQASLQSLKNDLIVTGKDYTQYTNADHNMALGFRVLASAQLEDYAEQRCRVVAMDAIDRIQRAQPSRAGRALITAFVVNGRGAHGAIPLEPAEFVPGPVASTALKAFKESLASQHGLSGKALRHLVVRLGVRDTELDDRLFDALDSLAEQRGAAAHLKVNRAKQMTEPVVEWDKINSILGLLEPLDEALETAITA